MRLKRPDESLMIKIQSYISYDLERDASCVVLRPIYGKRFEFLCKWFEKFSFKELKVQRENINVMCMGNKFGYEDEFNFAYECNDIIESQYQEFRNTMEQCMRIVSERYRTLDDFYKNIVEPKFDKRPEELPEGGADWLFEDLAVTKAVAPENYDRLKELLLRHIEWRMGRPEPNIKIYYPKLQEIFDYIENDPYFNIK